MLELLKDIEKQGTIEGFGNYTFNRGISGWKPERTMRLGTELHKLLLKMQADGLHINIDIPVEGEKGKYTSFYRGPDLEIDEKGQKVEVKGLAHLNREQLGRFVEEASRIYCQVMDVDYDKEAKEQL